MKLIDDKDTNVYREIGVANPDAMLIKAEITAKLIATLDINNMSYDNAAKLLKLKTSKLAEILSGQFHNITVDELESILTTVESSYKAK